MMNNHEIRKLRAEADHWRDYGTVDVCDAALGDVFAADAIGCTVDEARDKCRALRDESSDQRQICSHLSVTRDGTCTDCGAQPLGAMGRRQA